MINNQRNFQNNRTGLPIKSNLLRRRASAMIESGMKKSATSKNTRGSATLDQDLLNSTSRTLYSSTVFIFKILNRILIFFWFQTRLFVSSTRFPTPGVQVVYETLSQASDDETRRRRSNTVDDGLDSSSDVGELPRLRPRSSSLCMISTPIFHTHLQIDREFFHKCECWSWIILKRFWNFCEKQCSSMDRVIPLACKAGRGPRTTRS